MSSVRTGNGDRCIAKALGWFLCGGYARTTWQLPRHRALRERTAARTTLAWRHGIPRRPAQRDSYRFLPAVPPYHIRYHLNGAFLAYEHTCTL